MPADDRELQKRFLDLAHRAYSQMRYTYSEFLTLAEQDALLRTSFDANSAPFKLLGGYDGAERRAARFGSEELFGYTDAVPISCVFISPAAPKFADALTHRDFLGALMSLGVRRSVMGDIVLNDNCAYLFCLESVAGFIVDELTQVRHTTVRCTVLEQPPELITAEPEDKSINVASERLDASIAAVFKLSRNEAQSLFKEGKVFVNSRLTENTSFQPGSGDVISVRGYGRFIFMGVSGSSRKGRLFVTVQVY